MNPANKAVNPPKITNKNNTKSLYSKKCEQRITRKTPAVTIVAACNKEETGVGPSIASGNHVCKPIVQIYRLHQQTGRTKLY